MKKLLSLLLTFLLIFTLIPIGAITVIAATSGTTGDCTWTLDGTVLTISGNGRMEDYNEYDNPSPWGKSITQVIIKNGVTNIGDCAFEDCTILTSVIILDSVKSIGHVAFGGCTRLRSITIPNSVTSIGVYAFVGCENLTSITIPDSVTNIGDYAFKNTAYFNNSDNWENDVLYIGNHLITAKTSIFGAYTVKDGTKTIANCAFPECHSLTSITIPVSVTSIGDDAFYDCFSLANVIIGKGVTSIGVYAFVGCESLTSITIPDSVTSIGAGAFSGCTSLTSIIIPDSVTSIDNSVFNVCTSLTSITIPDSVTSIDYMAFYHCDSLSTVYFCGTEEQWNNISIGSYNDALTNATRYYTTIHKHNFETRYYCDWVGYYYCDCWCHEPDSVQVVCEDCFDCWIPESEQHYTTEEVYCTICGYIESSIDITSFYIVVTEPTCTEYGYSFRYCDYCESLVDEYFDYTEPLDHKYDNSCDDSCNVCGETRTANPHEYTNSCDTTCNVCGDIRTIEHIYDNACDTACNICGNVRSTTHLYDNICDSICNICGDVRTIEHSYINGSCEWCNSYIESKHNYDTEYDETWVITKENAAKITVTFSADTFVEEDWDFIYIYDGNDNEIGAYTGGELASKSITVSGDTVKIRLYSDKIITYYGFKVTDIKFTCDHNYITEVKGATCTEDGYKKHTCKHCGDVYYSDQVKSTGHKYITVVKAPICIEGGYTTHTCQNCGDSYVDSYTNATGVHIYENGNCTECNGYLESEHEYTNLFDKTWTIYRKGATSVTVTFSSNTFVEQRYDYIYIYDANDNEIGKYTGSELASKSITVSGDTVKIRLKTDRSQTYYGFKLTDISAEYVGGDINTDGTFDVLDFIYYMKGLADAENTTNIPDLDQNGVLNVFDLVMLKKYILGVLKF